MIPQQRLVTKLQAAFPYHQDLGGGMFTVAVDTPSLVLDIEHNRVGIQGAFTAYSVLNGTMQGNLAVSGSLRFDSAQRAIFLQQPRLDSLSLMHDDRYAELLRPAMNLILTEFLRTNALYRFKADELRYAGTDIDIGSVDVIKDGIRLKLLPKRHHP